MQVEPIEVLIAVLAGVLVSSAIAVTVMTQTNIRQHEKACLAAGGYPISGYGSQPERCVKREAFL